jgi:hypothetical protein
LLLFLSGEGVLAFLIESVDLNLCDCIEGVSTKLFHKKYIKRLKQKNTHSIPVFLVG